jgi:hypothetical protein
MSTITYLIRDVRNSIPVAIRRDFLVVAGVCCVGNTVLLCESAWARNVGYDEIYVLPQREVYLLEPRLQITFQELVKELTVSGEKAKWYGLDVLSEERGDIRLHGTHSHKRHRIFCVGACTETFYVSPDPSKYGAHIFVRSWYELEDYLSELAEHFPKQYAIIRRAVLRACMRKLLEWDVPYFLMEKFQREELRKRNYAPKPL